jgi:hypothetical protein
MESCSPWSVHAVQILFPRGLSTPSKSCSRVVCLRSRCVAALLPSRLRRFLSVLRRSTVRSPPSIYAVGLPGSHCNGLGEPQNMDAPLARSAWCIALMGSGPAHITETNRIHLILFGMQNRTCVSYLAATHRIIISGCARLVCSRTVPACRIGHVFPIWQPHT